MFVLCIVAVEQSNCWQLDSVSKAQPSASMFPDIHGASSMEMLVGSQKRKARKSRITHLVRTADGSVSAAEGEFSGAPFISRCAYGLRF